VAAFVGLSSLVPVRVAGGAADLWGTSVPVVGEAADGDYEAYVRPENIHLAAPGEPGVAGTVETSTFLGSFRRSAVRLADGQLAVLQHPAAEPLARGADVTLAVAPVPVVVRPT
jgi:putative spermidine/putrescine transport system ATP-binding protein